jgi:hypothetical protein
MWRGISLVGQHFFVLIHTEQVSNVTDFMAYMYSTVYQDVKEGSS